MRCALREPLSPRRSSAESAAGPIPHARRRAHLCCSHGALFEKSSGYLRGGVLCAGRALTPVALDIRYGFVLLAKSVDVNALAQTAC